MNSRLMPAATTRGRLRPIRICVVDDHPIVHDGLRYLTSQTHDIEFCGGALNGRELEGLLRNITPDILLLDVNLNGENSFALCRKIKDRYPDLQILVVSAFGDVHLLQKAVQAGASGYALKSVSMTELPMAIRHLDKKGTYFSPSLSQYVLGSLGRPIGTVAELTPRETAIIRLIGQGLTNLEIARELAISIHTVKFHVSQLLQRHQFRRRSELVKLIEALGSSLPG
jgi:two-component system, NarL family, response regulator DevR